jgi:hypothetical protein
VVARAPCRVIVTAPPSPTAAGGDASPSQPAGVA